MDVYADEAGEMRLVGHAAVPPDCGPVFEVPLFGPVSVIRERFTIGTVTLLAEVGRRQDWQRGDEVVFQEQPLPASWAWVEGVSPGRFTAALEQELARLQAQQRLLRSQAGLSPPERRALELLEQDLAMLEAELTLRR